MNEEIIKNMIKKAESKLNTAIIDFNNEFYDDAVSRAYYAVFHAISAVLFTKGFSYSSHSQVIGGFNKEFVKNGIFESQITKKIQTLFEDRQSGDYDFSLVIDKEDANKNIEYAKEILDSVKKYLKNNNILD